MCWYYKYAPLLLVRAVLGTEPRVSRYARQALYQLSFISSSVTRRSLTERQHWGRGGKGTGHLKEPLLSHVSTSVAECPVECVFLGCRADELLAPARSQLTDLRLRTPLTCFPQVHTGHLSLLEVDLREDNTVKACWSCQKDKGPVHGFLLVRPGA